VKLESYRRSRTDTEKDLISTYIWNVSLCESFYPVLHNFEIALRNNFNSAISQSFSESWLVDTCSSRGDLLFPDEVNSVMEAAQSLKRKGEILSNTHLMSELSLGFWISLLYSKYESHNRLYPKLFRDKEFFPYIPRRTRTRNEICSALVPVKKLRNAIFHYNPVWKNGKKLVEEHSNILEIIKWVSPILADLTEKQSRFLHVYQQGPTISLPILEGLELD
jgi:hypothetical protein